MNARRLLFVLCLLPAGCSAFPDVVHEPQYHNPFPQLSRVAVLPFFNQSADPTVDQEAVATLLQRVSRLVEDLPEIREMDLNPVKAFEKGKGPVVVDARIRI